MNPKTVALLSALGVAISVVTIARADSAVPPWSEKGEVPLPLTARSVVPRGDDVAIFAQPAAFDARRGTAMEKARLPLFGAKRAPGCQGRWLLVGPFAWVCSDLVEVSAEEPFAPQATPRADGLPYRYFFTAKDGASGYPTLATANEDAADIELDAGWGVAAVEEKTAHGETWEKTRSGHWIAAHELIAARPSSFHGESVRAEDVSAGAILFAWVRVDRAKVVSASSGGKAIATRARFQRVEWMEERAGMVRISRDDASAPEWMAAADLTHPIVSVPPAEAANEKWIDVDLATQTLVAYDKSTPVYATLVSTGVGPKGSPSATPPGVHRIWVKLKSSDMGNLDQENEAEDGSRYSIEDVPWVQFFDKGVALHAVFWHSDFGRVKSHGCVNLAPLDARWLFAFTSPHLPASWTAVLPSPVDAGTVVRVR